MKLGVGDDGNKLPGKIPWLKALPQSMLMKEIRATKPWILAGRRDKTVTGKACVDWRTVKYRWGV